jgi:hypothetical protein
MTHDVAVLKAREIASRVLAPSAGQNDKAGRFSSEAVESLGESGLFGLLLPVDFGGSGLGPRTFAVVMATLAPAPVAARRATNARSSSRNAGCSRNLCRAKAESPPADCLPAPEQPRTERRTACARFRLWPQAMNSR